MSSEITVEAPPSTPQDETSVTAFIADMGRSIVFDDIPEDVVRRLKFCVLDWLGITLIGMTTDTAQIVAETVGPWGDQVGGATVFGAGFARASLSDAALVNGTASHALELDDGSGTGGLPHNEPTIVTTAMALAEHLDVSGKDLLVSILAGHECGVRVTNIMTYAHYQRGYHQMATHGCFAATAVGARLMGLDHQQWLTAFGVAGSAASGLRANVGTMTKPLHAGLASRSAVLACQLAKKGFTAVPNVLEARHGYASTMTPVPRFEDGFRPLGRPYVVEGMRFKYHAACSGTHSPIEATKYLLRAENFTPADIADIDVATHRGHLDVCNLQNPQTPLEAKFSIRYATALAVLDEDTTEGGFTEERLADARMREAMSRISVRALDGDTVMSQTEVRVHLKDGRELLRRHSFAEHRLTMDDEWAALVEKFRRVCARVMSPDRASRLVAMVEGIDGEESMRSFVQHVMRVVTGD